MGLIFFSFITSDTDNLDICFTYVFHFLQTAHVICLFFKKISGCSPFSFLRALYTEKLALCI